MDEIEILERMFTQTNNDASARSAFDSTLLTFYLRDDGPACLFKSNFGFLGDIHVAHHFFSAMPHYHAVETTCHIKKVLGKHSVSDMTPISLRCCKYREYADLEKMEDVVFYQN
ncbi:hypothetical protein BDA99DRAFT_542245 [Phascolomyces articulosus]|uniref:Uncharacterized protein n=1 Tax=Phascolomyces articulosus TaxID=60185 RepID=A0AAD5JQN1_9FUNG|nr:hypothetical protein BDA99DRAFT_542245 [Phascolomyces articulosus]